MEKMNLYDKYSKWIRSATQPDDVESVMECVDDDLSNGSISAEEHIQLRELAENVTAALQKKAEAKPKTILLCWSCAQGHGKRRTSPLGEKTICQICGRRAFCTPCVYTPRTAAGVRV